MLPQFPKEVAGVRKFCEDFSNNRLPPLQFALVVGAPTVLAVILLLTAKCRTESAFNFLHA
jgi:hypothetical protein